MHEETWYAKRSAQELANLARRVAKHAELHAGSLADMSLLAATLWAALPAGEEPEPITATEMLALLRNTQESSDNA